MATDEPALEFSLVFAEKKIKLTSAEEEEKEYFLRELNGTQRDAYLTKMGHNVKYSKSGDFLGLKSFDGLHSSLVCRTLFLTETGESVSMEELQKMPAKVLSELFKISQKMSGLEEDADKNAGED